jgi:hypothetical protein
MTDDTPLPFDLPSVRRKKLTVDFAGGNQSSNGGKHPGISLARRRLGRISGAAIALDIHLQDCGVMDEAIDGRERHSLVGEDPGPGGPPNGQGPTRRVISRILSGKCL